MMVAVVAVVMIEHALGDAEFAPGSLVQGH
jgi:hypothetical protein